MPGKRTETVSAEKQKGGSTIFFLFWCEDPESFFTTEQNRVFVTSLLTVGPLNHQPQNKHTPEHGGRPNSLFRIKSQ